MEPNPCSKWLPFHNKILHPFPPPQKSQKPIPQKNINAQQLKNSSNIDDKSLIRVGSFEKNYYSRIKKKKRKKRKKWKIAQRYGLFSRWLFTMIVIEEWKIEGEKWRKAGGNWLTANKSLSTLFFFFLHWRQFHRVIGGLRIGGGVCRNLSTTCS